MPRIVNHLNRRFFISALFTVGALVSGPFMGDWQNAKAHDLFAAFIQHRVAIAFGAKHVDVTVQLTFFEEGSAHEREHMDANGDGRLSRAEIDAYLLDLEPKFNKAVTLQIGGRPVTLTPLRATDLDLLGDDRVGRGHHRLLLYFFAPTPAGLTAETEMLVEDRLWPGARALGVIQAEGKDGYRLEALPLSDPVLAAAEGNEARAFKARVQPPAKWPIKRTGSDRVPARKNQATTQPSHP